MKPKKRSRTWVTSSVFTCVLCSILPPLFVHVFVVICVRHSRAQQHFCVRMLCNREKAIKHKTNKISFFIFLFSFVCDARPTRPSCNFFFFFRRTQAISNAATHDQTPWNCENEKIVCFSRASIGCFHIYPEICVWQG